MPIVPNLAHQTQFVDQNFCSWTRKNAGAPGGTLTPAFRGEIVLDTTNDVYYVGVGSANTDWVAKTPRV